MITKQLLTRLKPCQLISNNIRGFSTKQAKKPAIYLSLHEELLHLKISDNLQYSLLPSQCRENCCCDLCKLKPSRHRNANNTMLTANELNNIYIKHAAIDNENEYIYLKWSDNHEGYIGLNELLDNTHITQDTHNYISWCNAPESITMDNEYNDIMFNDEDLLSFYHELQLNGLALIRNSTSTDGTVLAIAQRLATHVYPTVFGNSFCVEIKDEAINQAYTGIKLGLHTDLPYYVVVPEYFVFHCMYNESTGSSLYSDGFYLANEMKTHYPEQFEILSTVSVPYRDHQHGQWDFSSFKKVIEIKEDAKNEYRIHYNEGVRSSLHWKIDNKIKKDFYHALSIFSSMAQSPEFQYEFEMESGDCFVFNNTRVMHGRQEFNGQRKMEGCFFMTDAMSAMKKKIQFHSSLSA